MNDIKLGISKSRGYENVDLETLCNKKTPQDGEQKNTLKGAMKSFLSSKAESFELRKENTSVDDVLMFINLVCAAASVVCWILYFFLKSFGL